MKTYSKLETFLKATRKRCIKFARHPLTKEADFHISKDYTYYGKDTSLFCMCAVASNYLMYRMVNVGGFNPNHLTFIEGLFEDKFQPTRKLATCDINHCWLKYRDVILDLTLKQFVKNAPCIITKNDELFSMCYEVKTFIYSDNERRHRSQKLWPNSQSSIVWTPQRMDQLIDAI
jgi:hypothetical protein